MIKEIERMIERARRAVYTISLGIIEEVDYTTLRCRIKPKAKIKDTEGNYVEMPSLEDVPLVCLKGGDSVIITAPKKGDVVLLLHQYFPINLKNNKTYDVPYERRQAFSDVIAIPAVFVEADTIPALVEDEILIFHKSKSYAKFDKDGNITISDEAGANKIEIDFSTGKINIKTSTEIQLEATNVKIVGNGNVSGDLTFTKIQGVDASEGVWHKHT